MTDDPDQRVADYNRGFLAADKHTTPSKETERRLSALTESVKDIPVRLAHIDDKQESMGATLDAILTQTKATNGRVNRLEMWKYAFMAIITVVTMASGVIMTLLIQNLDYRINSAVHTVLDSYQIEVIK